MLLTLCRQLCQYQHCTSFNSQVICKKKMFSARARVFFFPENRLVPVCLFSFLSQFLCYWFLDWKHVQSTSDFEMSRTPQNFYYSCHSTLLCSEERQLAVVKIKGVCFIIIFQFSSIQDLQGKLFFIFPLLYVNMRSFFVSCI